MYTRQRLRRSFWPWWPRPGDKPEQEPEISILQKRPPAVKPGANCWRGELRSPANSAKPEDFPGGRPQVAPTSHHRSSPCRGELRSPANPRQLVCFPSGRPQVAPTSHHRSSSRRGELRSPAKFLQGRRIPPAGDHRSPLHRTIDLHPVGASCARPPNSYKAGEYPQRATTGRPYIYCQISDPNRSPA